MCVWKSVCEREKERERERVCMCVSVVYNPKSNQEYPSSATTMQTVPLGKYDAKLHTTISLSLS